MTTEPQTQLWSAGAPLPASCTIVPLSEAAFHQGLAMQAPSAERLLTGMFLSLSHSSSAALKAAKVVRPPAPCACAAAPPCRAASPSTWAKIRSVVGDGGGMAEGAELGGREGLAGGVERPGPPGGDGAARQRVGGSPAR